MPSTVYRSVRSAYRTLDMAMPSTHRAVFSLSTDVIWNHCEPRRATSSSERFSFSTTCHLHLLPLFITPSFLTHFLWTCLVCSFIHCGFATISCSPFFFRQVASSCLSLPLLTRHSSDRLPMSAVVLDHADPHHVLQRSLPQCLSAISENSMMQVEQVAIAWEDGLLSPIWMQAFTFFRLTFMLWFVPR